MVFHVIVLFIFSEFSADYSWLLCHSMAPDSDELKLQCKLLVVRLKGTRTGSGSEQQLMSLRIPRLEEAGEVLKTTTSRLNLQCSSPLPNLVCKIVAFVQNCNFGCCRQGRGRTARREHSEGATLPGGSS